MNLATIHPSQPAGAPPLRGELFHFRQCPSPAICSVLFSGATEVDANAPALIRPIFVPADAASISLLEGFYTAVSTTR